jgi:hypothetical protein
MRARHSILEISVEIHGQAFKCHIPDSSQKNQFYASSVTFTGVMVTENILKNAQLWQSQRKHMKFLGKQLKG